jgi:tyrosyl-tRNA synthetase
MRIITDFHDESAARDAREEFERIFKKGGEPDQVPEHRFPIAEGKISLPALLVSVGFASSRSEADRLLRQGAVRLDDEKPPAGAREIPATSGERRMLRVGKRRFARVTFE